MSDLISNNKIIILVLLNIGFFEEINKYLFYSKGDFLFYKIYSMIINACL